MKFTKLSILAALTAWIASHNLAIAEDVTVQVEGAWSRASILANRPGAAYMTITNNGDTLTTITSVKSEIAGKTEIHKSETKNGIATMTPSGAIDINPKEAVVLEPGGLHIMLMKLSEKLNEGDRFYVTLIFDQTTEVRVEVPVLEFTARGPQK